MMIAIHLMKNSPKKPKARFSIYLQRHRIGISMRHGCFLYYKHLDKWALINTFRSQPLASPSPSSDAVSKNYVDRNQNG